jgi:hypothetical protein
MRGTVAHLLATPPGTVGVGARVARQPLQVVRGAPIEDTRSHAHEGASMSITGLKREVQAATQNQILSQAEVQKIAAEVAPSVSNGEAQVLADLYDKTQPQAASNGPTTSFRPAEVQTTARTMTKLEAMMAKNNLPIGDNRAAMKDRFVALLATTTLDASNALAEAPRGAKSMLQLPLWDESRGMPSTWDGVNQTAYVDAGRQQFFVHHSGGRGRAEAFYGPFALE